MIRAFVKNIRDRLKNFVKFKNRDSSEAPEQEIKKPDDVIADRQKLDHRRSSRNPRKKEAQKKGTVQTSWDVSEFDVPHAEGQTRFHDLDLPSEIMHAVADAGYRYCTPIQAEILPGTLAGRDATGRAQTGTGKTAAFLISILTHMLKNPLNGKRSPGTPRALIIAPTRELVLQIAKDADILSKYCPFNIVSIFGGMDYQKQLRKLTEPVDIIAATPGRLLDFYEHREIFLDKIEFFVIDEADRMLDMGFIPQVRRIINGTPPKNKRQTLFFSATLTPEIARLAEQWTQDPINVDIEPEQVEAESVNQIVYIVTTDEKFALLYNIITRLNLERVMVFCNRKVETGRIYNLLQQHNIKSAMISGDVAQNKRVKTLDEFREGKIRILVATDVAGRGLHIEGVSHVVNYNLPIDPEDYVHRIGRTGRAGSTGTSVSFADEQDSFQIPDLEKFLGHQIQCTHPEEEWLSLPKTSKRHVPRKQPAQKTPKRRSSRVQEH